MGAIKHPARHFIYYLLSRRIHDAKAVIEMLERFDLPVPTEHEEFDRLAEAILDVRRNQMAFPASFDPRADPLDEESAAFLAKWRIRDVWQGSRYVAAATDLLSEPQIRHQLELMLLGPMSAIDIAARIAERFGLPMHAMNAGVVRSYAHYYWDITALDPGQWRRFIDTHYENTKTELQAAYKAPRNSSGAAFVIALADRDFQSLPPVDRYEVASSMAFGMLMQHALADDKSTGHTYAAFAALNMMRAADEELDRHRGGSSDLLAEFEKIRTLYDKQQPLKITEATYIQRPVLEAQYEESDDEQP